MSVAAYSTTATSAAVLTGAGYFLGAVLTGGSDTATLIIYDNTSATGTVVCKLAAAANVSVAFTPDARLPVKTGLYAALTGTAPSATIVYGP